MNTYFDSITLTKTLPCLAEPGKIIVIGKPDCPLDEVLPYLATLPGIIAWNPDALTLTFRRPRGFMTLYPDKVYITQVKDAAEGLELLLSVGLTLQMRQAVGRITQAELEVRGRLGMKGDVPMC